MKNVFTLLFLFIGAIAYSQVPQGFNYQAIYRDAQGNPIAEQNVTVQFTIINGSINGATVYSETQSAQTNQFGLFTLVIGQGTPVSGDFSNITWGDGSKFLKVEVDENLLGTTQLLSVPYALYAEKSGDSPWSSNGNDIYYDAGKVLIGTDAPEQLYPGYALQIATPGFESGIYMNGSNGGSNYNSFTMRDFNQTGWSLAHKSNGAINHELSFEYLNGVNNQQNYKTFKITPEGKSGFGFDYNEAPPSRLSVKNGDINILDIGSGVIMKSPNGQCWRMTVDNSGQPIFTSITCP